MQRGRQNCAKSPEFWGFLPVLPSPASAKCKGQIGTKTSLFSEITYANFGYFLRFSTGTLFNSTQHGGDPVGYKMMGRGAEALREEVIRPDEYVDICPNCGGLFSQNARGRRKKFCSEKCRTAWNHRHPKPENWKNTSRTVICPECGKEFTATREYGHLRKYCSRACANRGRAAERRKNAGTETR